MAKLKIDWRVLPEVAWRGLIFVIALTILIVVTSRWNGWQGAAGWQETDDAYLQADLTPIAAKVPGYLTDVPVQDYQQVKAGQVIAQVYDHDYKAQVAQAQAQLASATAQAAALKAQISL